MGTEKKEIAILMAAGMGVRMSPLTDTTAKPLVKVGGVPLVETVIAALERRGVAEIYVVTGYRAEQFGPLALRHRNVTLVYNAEFSTKNNINSVAVVADRMASADCFICESDLFVSDAEKIAEAVVRDVQAPENFGLFWDEVVDRLVKRGCNTDYIGRTEDGLGIWLAIFDETGDVAGSISRMASAARRCRLQKSHPGSASPFCTGSLQRS